MLGSFKKGKSFHHDDNEDDEDDSTLVMYIDRIFPECGKTLEEFIQTINPSEDILRLCIRGF